VSTVISILEDVIPAQHLQNKLPIFLAAGDGPTEPGMSGKDLRSDGGWRIDPPRPAAEVGLEAAIAYVLALSVKTTDATIRRNADD
jgi:hypothetical protein